MKIEQIKLSYACIRRELDELEKLIGEMPVKFVNIHPSMRKIYEIKKFLTLTTPKDVEIQKEINPSSDAIEFSEWIRENYYWSTESDNRWFLDVNEMGEAIDGKTTTELYTQYKQTKNQTR